MVKTKKIVPNEGIGKTIEFDMTIRLSFSVLLTKRYKFNFLKVVGAESFSFYDLLRLVHSLKYMKFKVVKNFPIFQPGTDAPEKVTVEVANCP